MAWRCPPLVFFFFGHKKRRRAHKPVPFPLGPLWKWGALPVFHPLFPIPHVFFLYGPKKKKENNAVPFGNA